MFVISVTKTPVWLWYMWSPLTKLPFFIFVIITTSTCQMPKYFFFTKCPWWISQSIVDVEYQHIRCWLLIRVLCNTAVTQDNKSFHFCQVRMVANEMSCWDLASLLLPASSIMLVPSPSPPSSSIPTPSFFLPAFYLSYWLLVNSSNDCMATLDLITDGTAKRHASFDVLLSMSADSEGWQFIKDYLAPSPRLCVTWQFSLKQ